ncbi:site-specific integrase [Gilliamella sp. B3482]|uniref:tyrosine-type recombinase/integrase n=1 Tax=Gilliamella sp. B3482 TaxID=2817991 RepID=UPI00226A9410|nr:site-specific integrase [Gilliamella sp. B3482]MCX8580119.1 site-specific integrase [Gilliamella sp. B3482]
MSIKKRGEYWHIDIVTPDGGRIRQSTGTTDKRQALEYHDRLKAELWDTVKLNKKPQRLFEEAVILFLKDGKEQKSFRVKQARAEYFLSKFAGRELSSITGEEILKSLPVIVEKTCKKVSNATINRYRADIMRMFSLAYKLDWIDSVPFVPRVKEPKVRVRWITKEKAALLIQNLRLQWMKDVCFFALSTGARMSEIFTLTWHNVDLVNRVATVTNDNAKSGKARALLLNHDAVELIRKLRFKNNCEFVFTRSTLKRVYDIDRRDFSDACELSGIEDFHFHDLRHTWASWHVQAGTPLFTLKELGGWETLEMVKKYAHLNADHMLEFANNVTFTAQSAIDFFDTKSKTA